LRISIHCELSQRAQFALRPNRKRRLNKGKWWMMDDIVKKGVAAQELRQFVERVERLEDEHELSKVARFAGCYLTILLILTWA
jgi:hypothetical protein